MKTFGRVEVQLYALLISVLGGGKWTSLRSGRCNSRSPSLELPQGRGCGKKLPLCSKGQYAITHPVGGNETLR